MKTGLTATLLTGSALVLSGCATGTTTVIETQPGGPCIESPQPNLYPSTCTAGFTVKARRELQSADDQPMGTGADVASVVNFSSLKLSMIGTSVSYPTSGTFIITLKNQNGMVISQNSFPWAQSGSDIIASNTQNIANWMATVTQTIYYVDVETAPMNVGTTTGPNVFTATLEYNGIPMAITGSVWTSNCPTGPQSYPLLCS